MLVYRTQMQGKNYPKGNILHKEHGKSLKCWLIELRCRGRITQKETYYIKNIAKA